MKPKVLFIYIDISAKLGIIPYLSSLFSSHLEFESVLADQIDYDSIDRYQLILFSSALCRSRVSKSLERFGIPMYQCIRELNYTYIHKILEIPALSKVCIVSDREKNCEAILASLTSLGFTQYTYTIYYPGCELPDPSFQHAITPGEARFVPSTIRNVVDIGNRNVDMATLCYIIKLFDLPETILNHVSSNYTKYISNFMRHINFQSEDAMRYFIVRDKLLDTMELGMCVTDSDGRIQMANQMFCSFLCMDRIHVRNRPLPALLEEHALHTTLEQLLSGEQLRFKVPGAEAVCLFYASSFESSTRDMQFLFLMDSLPSAWKLPSSDRDFSARLKRESGFPAKDSNLYRLVSKNRRIEYICHTAITYAESDFPVLLLGEPGLFQTQLAHFIHMHSSRANCPFVYVDASHPFSEFKMKEGVQTITSCAELERMIAEPSPFTLFIPHLERSTREFQYFLCSVLEKLNSQGSPASGISGPKLICTFNGDLQEQAASGSFLSELFFQISTLTLKLPPVREMKECIPFFYDFIFSELFLGSAQKVETMFTGQLLDFLMNYDYPGNFKELENLCRYFYYCFNGKRLTLAQLPSYIHCGPAQKETLSLLEREILEIIMRHPHSGRNKIHVLLSARGTELTPHQIRTILTVLADKAYIKVLKTKQGCEITELGEYILQCCDT